MEISKSETQVSILPKPQSHRLQSARHALIAWTKGGAAKLQSIRSALGSGRRQESVGAAIARVLWNVRNKITKPAGNAGERPTRLREARCTKETRLRNFVATSVDATIVTDGNRRLLAANAKALELFGISQSNLSNFSIDAFFPIGQVPEAENTSVLLRRRERQGECKIRRLDGGLRKAKYVFVANFLPRLHLYKFLNPTSPKPICRELTTGRIHARRAPSLPTIASGPIPWPAQSRTLDQNKPIGS